MGIIDLLGHLAYLFILLGFFLIGRKNIWGWPIKAVGDVIWLCLGIYMGMTSIWMWEICFLYLTYAGYKAWRRNS